MPEASDERTALGSGSALELAGLVLVCVKIVGVLLAFDPLSVSSFALPKTTVSRAVAYPLALLVVAYTWKYWRQLSWRPPASLLGGYTLVAILATLFAIDQRLALFGSADRRLGLTSIVDGAVTALAVSLFIRSSRDLFVLGLAVGGAFIAVLAYFAVQIAGGDPFHWADLNRASTLGNTTVLAGALVVALAGAATAAVVARGSASRAQQVFIGVGLGLAALAVVAVTARGATLALAAGAAAALGLSARVLGRPFRARVLWLLLLAFVVAAGALVVSPAGSRLMALVRGGDQSTSERALIYSSAMLAVRQRPLLGWGPDTFGAVYPSVRDPAISVIAGPAHTQTSPHSWVLHTAVGTGVIGLVLLLIAVALGLIDGWYRAARPGGVVAAVGSAMMVSFLAQAIVSVQHVATETLFWTALGLMGLVQRQPAASVGARLRRTGPRWHSGDTRATAAALAVGIALSTTVVPSLVAAREVHAASRAAAGGRAVAAREHLERAVGLDPGRAEYWNALAIAVSGDGTQRALRAFARASEIAPYDTAYLLNLAREEYVLSSADANLREKAANHAREAARRDPYSPVTVRRAAEILYAAGDASGAAELTKRLAELFPLTQPEMQWAADVYEAAGRGADAIAMLETLAGLRWPHSNYPDYWRLRMAKLYVAHGNSVAADRIAPRARVSTVSRCATGCLVVEFDSIVELRSDQSSGSVVNAANYRISGVPLSVGTRLDLLSRHRIRITLPHGTDAPRNDAFHVSGVIDVLDRPMEPSSTVVP